MLGFWRYLYLPTYFGFGGAQVPRHTPLVSVYGKGWNYFIAINYNNTVMHSLHIRGYDNILYMAMRLLSFTRPTRLYNVYLFTRSVYTWNALPSPRYIPSSRSPILSFCASLYVSSRYYCYYYSTWNNYSVPPHLIYILYIIHAYSVNTHTPGGWPMTAER